MEYNLHMIIVAYMPNTTGFIVIRHLLDLEI